MAASLLLSREVAMLSRSALEEVLQMRKSACGSHPLSSG